MLATPKKTKSAVTSFKNKAMADYKNPYLKNLTDKELEIFEKIKPLLIGQTYSSFCKVLNAIESYCRNNSIISND